MVKPKLEIDPMKPIDIDNILTHLRIINKPEQIILKIIYRYGFIPKHIQDDEGLKLFKELSKWGYCKIKRGNIKFTEKGWSLLQNLRNKLLHLRFILHHFFNIDLKEIYKIDIVIKKLVLDSERISNPVLKEIIKTDYRGKVRVALTFKDNYVLISKDEYEKLIEIEEGSKFAIFEKEQYKKLLEQYKESIDKKEKRITELEEENESLRQRLKEIKEKYENKLKEKDEIIKDYENKLKEKEKEIENLRIEMEELMNRKITVNKVSCDALGMIARIDSNWIFDRYFLIYSPECSRFRENLKSFIDEVKSKLDKKFIIRKEKLLDEIKALITDKFNCVNCQRARFERKVYKLIDYA